MSACYFCGFEPKSKAALIEMGNGELRCKSGTACHRRLRSGDYLRRRVRLALEVDSPLDPDTLWALANIREADRIGREIRKALYRNGLCVDCGVAAHSPGRPRCEPCHRKLRA